MAVHLYGVLDTDAAPALPLRGLDGRVVRVIPAAGRIAWVSDIPEAKLEATPQRIREHDDVLRHAVAAGYSVVPSLFGRLHADEPTLVAGLQASEPALETAMALVRGRAEMSLLIVASGAAPAPEGRADRKVSAPGREHLLRLRNQVHAERILLADSVELAQSISRAIGDLVVAERAIESPAPPALVARAHLVARENIARYVRSVKLQAAAANPALRAAVRGPGAAYSFAAVQIG